MSYIVGFIIGSILGLTGAGGSVFAVPLLLYILKLSPQDAMGISLGAVAISALLGVFMKLKSQQIQWLPALAFLFIGALFSPLGAWLNRKSDEQWLMIGFAFLVVIVAFKLWRQAIDRPEETRHVRTGSTLTESFEKPICIINSHQPFKIGFPCLFGVIISAVVTGILSGLFGVGGGFLIVPTLIFLTHISMQQAVATSLVVISAVSGSGFISYIVLNDTINVTLLMQVIYGGLLGMIIGLFLSRVIAGPKLQKLFAVLMCIVGIMTLLTNL